MSRALTGFEADKTSQAYHRQTGGKSGCLYKTYIRTAIQTKEPRVCAQNKNQESGDCQPKTDINAKLIVSMIRNAQKIILFEWEMIITENPSERESLYKKSSQQISADCQVIVAILLMP